MLVGSKELLILIAHEVVRNFVVLTQLEEPLTALRVIDNIEFELIGQRNLQSFQNSSQMIIHIKPIQDPYHRMLLCSSNAHTQALHGLARKCKLTNIHALIKKFTNNYVTL